MKRRLKKFLRKLKAGETSGALRALTRPHHTETRVLAARKTVSDHLRRHFDHTVGYGPLKGLRLTESTYWGGNDISAKLLGTYERQVLDKLVTFSRPNGLMVDIGSADGYFGVGALKAGLFSSCICFEQSEKGRQVLAQNAKCNGVDERLTIYGAASAPHVLEMLQDLKPDVLLCDIEGGEFTLFTDRLLEHLSGSFLVIELHDQLVETGQNSKAALIDRASRLFDVEYIGSSVPDVFSYPELASFDDDHRLLAFSEGRDTQMEWLVLSPKVPAR